jgi:transcriptional regulator with XRE-family HTH domain
MAQTTKRLRTKGQIFGDRIRQVRELLQLSQVEFAILTRTTQANISQIEAGKSIPTGNFLIKLSSHLPNLNMNWLFYADGVPFRKTEKKFSQIPTKLSGLKSHEESEKKFELLNEFYTYNSKIKKK